MGFNGPSVKQSNDDMVNPPRAHWPEWLFSFACCGMIASNARNQRLEGEPFSVMTYYGQTPGVKALQGIGWVVAVAFILVAALWIMRPKWGYQCQHALTLISGMGFVVAWLELVTALRSLDGAPFRLDGLPYDPVTNLGLGGAQVFATYMMLRLPDGRLGPKAGLGVKLGLAVCSWIIQLMLWTLISSR